MARQIKFGDKLLLQGETLILDNGDTNPGVIRSKSGIVKIEGNLEVDGTIDKINVEEILLADNTIIINSNHTGAPTQNGGIEIERGDEDNAIIQWNETSDKFEFKVGSANADLVANTIISTLTGDVIGNVTGNITSTGISTFSSIDINAGTIDGTVIGADPLLLRAGTFTTLTATTINGALTGTVTSIANHDTDDLAEGSNNLYYTEARVDARYATLHNNADAGTLDGQDGTYYLDYTNFTNTPTVISSLANHSIDALSDVDTTTTAPTNGQTILWNASTSQFLPGDTFSEVVEDTTPQLGGTLDLNTHDLTTTDPTVTLTTSSTSSTSSTVVASSETNLSNTTVAFLDDTGNISTATSAYTTLTSTEIDTLGFKGDISLTYFGAAAISSNFVWRDVSDSAEQNDMIIVYAPTSDEYTFTLDHETLWQIDSTDNDVYFKQYAYGEFSITSATALTTSNTQLKDSNGFYIDPAHVTITNTSGTNYKIVFWTHDVSVGDVIEIFSPPEEIVVFGWGGITTTGGRLTLLDTSGNLIYKLPAADGTANQVLETDGSGDLSWTTDTDTIYTSFNTDFDTRLATKSTTNLSEGTNLYYTDGRADARAQLKIDTLVGGATAAFDTLVEIQNAMATDTELTSAISGLNHDTLSGFVANEHIDWSTDQGATNIHAGNYTNDDTIYTSFNTDFDTRLATKSTTNLSEGTNLYYTDGRARGSISVSGDLTYNSTTGVISTQGLASSTTDDLAEGSTNLYYTDARADARIDTWVGLAPTGLDTLVELSTALGNDVNFSTTITNSLAGKESTITLGTTAQYWRGDKSFQTLDTSVVAENTNLYYTDARFDTRLATKSTTNLAEGTNLYYTTARDTSQFNTDLATKSTTNLTEGTNLYYTDARWDTRLATKSTTNLAEGTNLYYTSTRANTDFDTRLATKDTDDLAEGSTNLYYTDARAQAVSINNLVEDTTPQLGGNLDLNTFDLSTTDPTVTLTTTLTPSLTQGTVAASSETNLSNTTVTVNDDGDYANAVSSYITLTSTELTNLDFEGEISLTYFGAAASTSNFVWRDVSDSAEQNNMVTVYAPPSDEYTFTLPTDPTFPINSADADIYFKQYAYGEMTITSATTLTGNNIQLKDANGFYIDKEHVTVASLGGTSYKVVFWTHSVSVGDVIDLVSPSAQTAIFEWGTSTFSETGLVATAESFSLTSSTNDIFAMGDLEFTTGNLTGEVVGTLIYDHPTNNSIISGLTTVTIDGTGYQSATTITDVPIIMTGNVGTSNELSLVVGSATDARLWLLDSSGNLIYKLPAADGTANQVMKTDGSGDLAWADDNDTTYTSSDFTHDDLTGFVANEHIDWTTDQGAINLHAGNYTDTDTTYTAGTNVSISGTNVISSTDTDTTYTAGTNVSISGTNVISSTYTDTIYTSFNTDFDTRLATKSTTDLSEGTNLYYTDSRADARAQIKVDALVGGASAAFDTLVEIQNAMATDTELTSAISGLNHDALSGFVANEHIDWTADQGATNIHAGNYTDTNTTYVDSDWNHDNLTGFVANEHIDWTAASAGTIDPSNYSNTGDTTYTAGSGLTLVGTVFSNTSPDQTVSLTGTGATTVTGTYPNFTIDSTNTTTSITGSIIPATDNTYDLGSTTKKYANIYGHTVEATYADIAERYATDVPYEEGTVVVFGGESEITTTTESGDVSVAGVISTNPALKLNVDAGNSQTHPYVALKGRVPCKMIGPVSKGDLIVTADNEPGYAQSIGKNDAGHSVFAKSIETDLTDGKKVIEVSIL